MTIANISPNQAGWGPTIKLQRVKSYFPALKGTIKKRKKNTHTQGHENRRMIKEAEKREARDRWCTGK